MRIWRSIKRGVRAVTVPFVLFGLSGYFIYSAMHGDRGLEAKVQREADLAAARAQLAKAQAELKSWERRVGGLRAERLDPDVLDERARAMLNLSDPSDVILPYGDGKKLF